MENDFLDELIAERSANDPSFPALVDAALNRRELVRRLAAERKALGLSQTALAVRMVTSQATVAQIESGVVDVKVSTVARYAAALGQKIEWRLVKESQ